MKELVKIRAEMKEIKYKKTIQRIREIVIGKDQ